MKQFTANQSMTKEQFLSHCRIEAAKREKTADDTYENYNLVLIGDNPNCINSYAVCSDAGRVYQIRAGRDYLIGVVGKNGYRANPDQTELCPDEHRIAPLNARLVAMGEAAFVRTKHSRIRFLLWMDLPEVAAKEVA